MFSLFLPGYVKQGKRLIEGVNKFVAYNKDLMPPEARANLNEAVVNFKAVLETRNADQISKERDLLMKACDASMPGYKPDAIKENIEVILVAVIVALGVRAYLVQPFKIPTASMQPTLNGLIGEAKAPSEAAPSVVKQAVDYVWRGSNFTELKAPQASGDLAVVGISQKSTLMFFTRTTVEFSDGSKQTCYAPAKQLLTELWQDEAQRTNFRNQNFPVDDFARMTVRIQVQPGAVLARGFVHTGDQLLVDKMSYHFRKPKRGEVFVFNTMGVPTSNPVAMPHNNVPSQHYIKRLVGVPNDKLSVVPPLLYVNGAPATETGILKVMNHSENPTRDLFINKLHGYTEVQSPPPQAYVASETVMLAGQPTLQFNLTNTQYFAMGDNSRWSSDSRTWGAVPQQNLVGPALVVYWPFAPHWGRIR